MSRTKWSIGVLILLLIAVAMASGLALVRAAPLPRYQLQLDSHYTSGLTGESAAVTFTVTNVSITNHQVEARQVMIEVDPPQARQDCQTHCMEVSSGTYEVDKDKGIWSIPNIPPGGTVTGKYFAHEAPIGDARYGDNSDLVPLRIRATIIEAQADRPAARLPSRPAERWLIAKVGTNQRSAHFGNVGIAVSTARTTPSETVRGVFSVSLNSDSDELRAEHIAQYGLASLSDLGSVFDIEVELMLSGLQLAGNVEAPEGTSFDPGEMIWKVGSSGERGSLSVPVSMSSSALVNEEPCLTAAIAKAVPPFELDARRKVNDVAKACLPKPAPQVVSEGEIDLFYFHGCDGNRISLCDDKDLNLLTKIGDDYFAPENVVVQIRDPVGRHEGKWRSGKTAGHDKTVPNIGGVQIAYNWDDAEVAGYDEGRSFQVDNVDDVPNTFRIYVNTKATFKWLDMPDRRMTGPYDFLPDLPAMVEFDTLGTHGIIKSIGARHTDVLHMDSATYTFHVGPISELEVRDAGEGSPLASGDERAYTIVAKHNGPDDAPMVVVELSGVPEGSRHILEEDGYFGTYAVGECAGGLCDATWTLGELPLVHGIVRGYRTEHPTLTLIAPSGAAAEPITASISQVGDYSVCIDGEGNDVRPKPADETACTGAIGSWHSTDYFDYFPDNNTAEIAALAGTGEGDPGTPTDVETIGTSAGTLIRWTEAEYLNLWPVVGYQVERTSGGVTTTAGDGIKGNLFLDETPGENPQYRVRSMNEWGVGSIWSERVGAPLGEPSVTVEPTQLTVARSGEASSADYTVVLDSPPTGADKQVSIGVSSGDAAKATVSRSTLVFSEANWNVPQTVTVTWADANASGSVEITHSVSGGGYDGVTADAVRVTASGMVLNVSKTELTMSESGTGNNGTYTIALSSAPASDVFVDISSGDSGVATVSPTRLVFTPTDYGAKTVTVTGVDDQFLNAGGERVTRISHRLGGGGLPAVTLAGPAVTVTG